jgi:hypothetical protein
MSIKAYLKVFHGEVDTICLAVRNLEVTRPCGASADDNCIILGPQFSGIQVDTNIRVRDEGL